MSLFEQAQHIYIFSGLDSPKLTTFSEQSTPSLESKSSSPQPADPANDLLWIESPDQIRSSQRRVVSVTNPQVRSKSPSFSADAFESEALRWAGLRNFNAAERMASYDTWGWSWDYHPYEQKGKFVSEYSPRERSGYLALKEPIRRTPEPANKVILPQFENDLLWEEDNLRHDAAVLTSPSDVVDMSQDWTVHVTYNHTWGVPVLYILARRKDGTPASWDALTLLLPDGMQDTSTGRAEWLNLSPEFHPVTGEPCVMLHPCRTSELMDLLFDSENSLESSFKSPLLSWFSLMCPVLGVVFPTTFFMYASRELNSAVGDG
jgi:hypothetical protein